MPDAFAMTYASIMMLSVVCGHGAPATCSPSTVEFMHAYPCSSPEVCALNTEFILRVTTDGKVTTLIPASAVDLESRKLFFENTFFSSFSPHAGLNTIQPK